jgi:hypothetical protein
MTNPREPGERALKRLLTLAFCGFGRLTLADRIMDRTASVLLPNFPFGALMAQQAAAT